MKRHAKLTVLGLVILISLSALAACGGDDEKKSPPPTGETPGQTEDVVITIGNLTDKTGPASSSLQMMDMALEDMVKYYNDNNLIPGVQIEVISYDAQYDASKHVPGYKWLIARGADLIYCADPNALEILKPRADEDKMLLFASSAQDALLSNPGYAFCAGTHPSDLVYTLMDWVIANRWDWQTNGPARVGIVGWNSANIRSAAEGMEAYCNNNPGRCDWGGLFVIEHGFMWQSEVEETKDYDFLYPPMAPMVSFARQYSDAGGKAKFVGVDAHAAFFSLISDAGMWEEVDGMVFARESAWWNETGELIDLTRKLVEENHPDRADEIKESGVGYLATSHALATCETIKSAAEEAGPANIDSDALYQAAQNLVLTVDGIEHYSFSETKRLGNNHVAIYEARAADEDMFRISEWLPLVHMPRD